MGSGDDMTHTKRARGSYRGLHLTAAAALGLALSACGGGPAGSSGTASAAQGAAPVQSSALTPSSASTQGPAPAQSPAPAQTSSGGTPTAAAGSGSSGGSPPAASAGAVTINWVAPTQNVDGSTLTNLSGYKIHYGTASNNYTQTIKVSNPGLATYVVDGLSPGTYYFSVSAYNSAGTESPLSSEVRTTVN